MMMEGRNQSIIGYIDGIPYSLHELGKGIGIEEFLLDTKPTRGWGMDRRRGLGVRDRKRRYLEE
jgi:hypothetical protein